MYRKHPTLLLVLFYALGVVIVGTQTFFASRQATFRGLLPYGGSEEAMYMLRTQEALHHPFADVTNGVWTGVTAPSGLQSSSIEEAIGTVFFWVPLSAPWLIFWLSLFITPLAIPFAAFLLRRVGMKDVHSVIVALGFFWLLAYFKRYFHPGFTLPLVMGELMLLWRWYERPNMTRSLLAGALLGWSVGTYLWAWTFLWPVAGILALGSLMQNAHKKSVFKYSCILFAVAVLVALPVVLRLLVAHGNPFFDAASLRAGLVASRLPESWIRSGLTLILAGLFFFLFTKSTERKSLFPLFAMLAGLAVDYNQQLIHGRVMSFSSHYIHYFTLACLLLAAAVYVHKRWTVVGGIAIGFCVLVLGTAITDYPGRVAAFLPPAPAMMSHQHLRGVIDALRSESQLQTVLTDRQSADLVASYTKHDVVFTEYAAFLLISDDEFIERACLGEVYAKEPFDFASQVTYAEEKLKVLREQQTQALYDQHLRYANTLCTKVRGNPLPYFIKYNVSVLLWDEINHPDWTIDQSVFGMREKGEGWSLWQPL